MISGRVSIYVHVSSGLYRPTAYIHACMVVILFVGWTIKLARMRGRTRQLSFPPVLPSCKTDWYPSHFDSGSGVDKPQFIPKSSLDHLSMYAHTCVCPAVFSHNIAVVLIPY